MDKIQCWCFADVCIFTWAELQQVPSLVAMRQRRAVYDTRSVIWSAVHLSCCCSGKCVSDEGIPEGSCTQMSMFYLNAQGLTLVTNHFSGKAIVINSTSYWTQRHTCFSSFHSMIFAAFSLMNTTKWSWSCRGSDKAAPFSEILHLPLWFFEKAFRFLLLLSFLCVRKAIANSMEPTSHEAATVDSQILVKGSFSLGRT